MISPDKSITDSLAAEFHMADQNIASTLQELPSNATNGEALAWVNRMRLLLDRWDTLPDSASRSMTPELKRQAYSELDDVEASVRRNMAC